MPAGVLNPDVVATAQQGLIQVWARSGATTSYLAANDYNNFRPSAGSTWAQPVGQWIQVRLADGHGH